MKKDRYGLWQWIDDTKRKGGMTSRPGASTVWIITDAGRTALEGQQQ